MGKSTNYVLGYGIRIEDIKGKTAYRVLKLIQAAPKYEKEIFDHLEETRLHVPKGAELMCLRLEEILQRVILEAEGLELVIAYKDDNEETFLLYPPSYPWKMMVKRMNLTRTFFRAFFGNMFRFSRLNRFLSVISITERTMLLSRQPGGEAA